MLKTCLTMKPVVIEKIKIITGSVIHRFRKATSL